MKKMVLAIVFMLAAASAIQAQGFDIGLKAGYLYSDMKEKNLDGLKTEGNGGYFVGLFTRFNSEKWFFQPELQYRVRTTDVVTSSDVFGDIIGKDNKVKVDLKTIDVPLQVGYNLLNLSVLKLAVHAGPTLSFKIADDTTIKNEVNSFDLDKFTDYKSFIWSGQVGLVADISRFTVGVAYEKGLSDVAKESLGENDLIMVNVGLKF